jgi:alpha-amylase/alpha-mannosidase (GH57 family)
VYWSNFIHIYQPPTQTEEIVCKVTNECYRILVKILNEAPNGKVTLNISAVLTEQLARFGLDDVIKGIRKLAERGQIELTGSAMYHPILPLIPRDEVIRQVRLNTEVNRHYFGDIYNPQGFFPPEMCYNFEVAQSVAELGFRWIIIDEIGLNGKIGSAAFDRLYQIDGLHDFLVFFKERPFSAGITYGAYPSAEPFVEALKDRQKGNSYLLSGTDGEMYGHHRPGQEKLLSEVFAGRTPKTCTISELISLFNQRETVDPLPSSWSTWEDEMARGIPYPQWSYPGHELHKLQWQLTNLALQTIGELPEGTSGLYNARGLLDKGLHSCQYWWASCRPWWSVDMIMWGAQELYQAAESVAVTIETKKMEEITKTFQAVTDKAREWQKTGEARRLKNKYKKEHPEVSTELTFGD